MAAFIFFFLISLLIFHLIGESRDILLVWRKTKTKITESDESSASRRATCSVENDFFFRVCRRWITTQTHDLCGLYLWVRFACIFALCFWIFTSNCYFLVGVNINCVGCTISFLILYISLIVSSSLEQFPFRISNSFHFINYHFLHLTFHWNVLK